MSVWVDIHKRSNGDAVRMEEIAEKPFVKLRQEIEIDQTKFTITFHPITKEKIESITAVECTEIKPQNIHILK